MLPYESINFKRFKEESDDKSGVDRLQTQLNNFVDTVYNELNATQDSTTCIVQSSVAPDASIRDYATKTDIVIYALAREVQESLIEYSARTLPILLVFQMFRLLLFLSFIQQKK